MLIGETHDLLQLIIQAIRHDLESRNPVFNTLAMQCVANIASQDMAEQLGKDVAPLLVSPYVGEEGGEGGREGGGIGRDEGSLVLLQRSGKEEGREGQKFTLKALVQDILSP